MVEESKVKTQQSLIKEFQEMRDFAELKALSNVSLERPLYDWEFQRMMDLKVELMED